MTVILSASRYAYSPAFRTRASTGDEAAGFSSGRTDQTDPDGSNAGSAVKPRITRQVEETSDTRFEFNLPYRSAFFNTAGQDDNGSAARDGSSEDQAASDTRDSDTLFGELQSGNAPSMPESADSETVGTDGLPENPIDLLVSLLGGTSAT